MRPLLVVLALASLPLDARSDARAGEKRAQPCLSCCFTGTPLGRFAVDLAHFLFSKAPVTEEAVN